MSFNSFLGGPIHSNERHAKLLRDWLPHEALDEPKLKRHLDRIVIEDNSFCRKPWIGKHRNVMNWCVITGGYAVGWNESPSRGWSFPVIKLSVKEQ